MENVLLVEDSKLLAKTISRKLSRELDYGVVVSHTLNKAKEELQKNKFFLALLDLHLPDAPNGEVVDLLLSHNIPSIVLTATLDDETRNKILKKDIVDYVKKEKVEDIEYVVATINRISQNRKYKVLVVDDSVIFRKSLKKVLDKLLFDVYLANDGIEALKVMNENPDIKVVFTDYNMPNMDGLELTSMLRKKYAKDELGIVAISSEGSPEISAKFLKRGANDFIKKPFSKEEITCRINNTIEYIENISKIKNSANRDFLTNLYNRRYFFKTVNTYYKSAKKKDENFAIAMLDIDKFKNINDTYGHKVGDDVIKSLAQVLVENTKGSDVVSRFGGEEFCVVLKDVNKEQAYNIFEKIRKTIENNEIELDEIDNPIRYTISIGVTMDKRNSLEDMINYADELLYLAKNSGRNKVIIN